MFPFRRIKSKPAIDNRRQHYRVVFPENNEIHVEIDGLTFPLRDVSLNGMRIIGKNVPVRRGKCHGTVIWSDQSECPFTGLVHRRHRGHTVLFQVKGIPSNQIIREQQRLLKTFPHA